MVLTVEYIYQTTRNPNNVAFLQILVSYILEYNTTATKIIILQFHQNLFSL